MKKLLVMFAILISGFASAQEFSVNGGTFLNSEIINVEGNDDQRFMGYFEFTNDLVKSNFRLAPVVKMFFYDGSLSEQLNGPENSYGFSTGLEAGFDFKGGHFAVGYEVPIPDQRAGIFEAVISPSVTLVNKGGFGFKVNYDYFINQRLFQYNGAFSAGVVYKF